MNIPKNPVERRAWIIHRLRFERGLSLRQLALREGVTPQAMSHALMSASSHLQTVIADELGLTPQQLFPEFFATNGERLTWTRDQHRITRASSRNVEEGRAA